MITLAIPTYQRFVQAFKLFQTCYHIPEISEIVIVDDCSDDYERFKSYLNFPKLKLFRNGQNLGATLNKIEAVRRSESEWVALIDSDNLIDEAYIGCMIGNFADPKTIYCPAQALPNFDYSQFIGKVIDIDYMRANRDNERLWTLLNTGNYFVNRNAYIEAAKLIDTSVNWKSFECQYFNIMWLLNGGKFEVVNTYYQHAYSEDGQYMKYAHESGAIGDQIREMI